MMLHVTKTASIYMENMWFWVAGQCLLIIYGADDVDHHIDAQDQAKLNIYGGRGVLIESKGPSWIHSASSEHSTLYNWQLSNAENIYMGHIQSESPYFQGGQLISTKPYAPSKDLFVDDPSFSDCGQHGGIDTCREAWALRILNSTFVYMYGGGFYSFFQDYQDNCAKFGNTCQDKLVETDFSQFVYLYNIWTIGAKEAISPQG
jgi:glucan 1,3-beta-glucosidase